MPFGKELDPKTAKEDLIAASTSPRNETFKQSVCCDLNLFSLVLVPQ